MSVPKKKKDQPTIIKKYANRRLYDTGRSSYITLDDLCEMVCDGYDFIVVDAKSGEDITRPTLTQIIMEQESKGQKLLPTAFLRQLISFYGDNVQPVVPGYLESMMEIFTTNQDRLKTSINKSLEQMSHLNTFLPGGNAFEEMRRQNAAMLERTIKMFGSLSSPTNDQSTPVEKTPQDQEKTEE